MGSAFSVLYMSVDSLHIRIRELISPKKLEALALICPKWERRQLNIVLSSLRKMEQNNKIKLLKTEKAVRILTKTAPEIEVFTIPPENNIYNLFMYYLVFLP